MARPFNRSGKLPSKGGKKRHEFIEKRKKQKQLEKQRKRQQRRNNIQ